MFCTAGASGSPSQATAGPRSGEAPPSAGAADAAPLAAEKDGATCGPCAAGQPGSCGDCGGSRADPEHARAEWATVVAGNRPGQSPFWRMALAADAFFRTAPGQASPDPGSPIAFGMRLAQSAFSSASALTDRVGSGEVALRIPDAAESARGSAGRVSGLLSNDASVVDLIDIVHDPAAWIPSVDIGASVDLLDRDFASLMGAHCVTPVFPMLQMAVTGACCAVKSLAIWMVGGKNITKISVVVVMEWREAPAGILAPCGLGWNEKTDCTYSLPGMPGNVMPGDDQWHQIYPGTKVQSGTFTAWESGQAQGAKKASEAASSGGLPVSQKTTVDDPALWDAQKALKTCGKSTRYLTIGVWATSGCRTGSDFYAEATTYGYADSTTSPKEPTKTEGKAVD